MCMSSWLQDLLVSVYNPQQEINKCTSVSGLNCSICTRQVFVFGATIVEWSNVQGVSFHDIITPYLDKWYFTVCSNYLTTLSVILAANSFKS